jgi:predicted AlkP superfamily pyrophosphatase or phosphodiesterase
MQRALGALVLAILAFVASPATAEPPSLVVVLVVDQMRNDYIDDYGRHWTKGLAHLVSKGARFKDASYTYLNTVTCAGHATIGTGTVPAVHGILLNEWWDRDAGKALSCTDDPASPTVSLDGHAVPAGHHSAARLLVPTLAETLRKDRHGRAVTISLKPRSAIMLAGHEADAVVWFSGAGWASSTAYAKAPLPWVQRYVAAHPVERDNGKQWVRRLPAHAYRYDDDAIGEKPIAGWTGTFPHAIGQAGPPTERFYDQWEASPYADAYLGELAAAAISDLKLGKGKGTDFLGVSFSSLDLVGHNFGPRSHEVQDMLAGLDETIGKLLAVLDRKVGRGRYVLALSADHGVACIPEQLQKDRIDAGRVVMDGVTAEVNQVVADALGEGTYVARLMYTNLYFKPGAFDRVRKHAGLLDKVKAAIMAHPGVDGVLVGADLDYRHPPADRIARAAAFSQYASRAGDLIILPKLNWFISSAAGTPAATHGTAHPYDAGVPLVLLGKPFVPGTYAGAAAPIDIAATFAHVCGVGLPRATGRVLEPALRGALPGPATK